MGSKANTIWERLFESTEGPTVTLRIPRQLAEDLLAAISIGIETSDSGDDMELDLGPDMPGMDGPDQDSDDEDAIVLFGGDDDDSDDDHDDDEDDEDESTAPRPKTALGERRIGFDKLKAQLGAKGAKDPGGLAADIGRKKYGTARFQSAASKGKKLP